MTFSQGDSLRGRLCYPHYLVTQSAMPNIRTTLDKHYPRPPITEAVLALHFKGDFDHRTLERFSIKQKNEFPRSEKLVENTISITANQKPTIKTEPHGIKLTSEDKGRITRIGGKQFAVIHLAPYNNWDDLLSDAQKQWSAMRTIEAGKTIEKISTRFINRIDIPAKADQHIALKDYFNLGISLPKALAGAPITAFELQTNLMDPSQRYLQIVRSRQAQPPPLIDHLSIVLDIDVVSHTPLPTKDEDVWSLAGELRALKNGIFENCITDKSRALFQ